MDYIICNSHLAVEELCLPKLRKLEFTQISKWTNPFTIHTPTGRFTEGILKGEYQFQMD